MPMSGPEEGQNQERTVDHLFDDDVEAEMMDIDDPVDEEAHQDEAMKTYFFPRSSTLIPVTGSKQTIRIRI